VSLYLECLIYFGVILTLALLAALLRTRPKPPPVWAPPEPGDLFDRNLAAIMAEERLALSINRPEAFVRIVSTV